MWKLYLEASLIGAISKNLILPFEHPFEVIKTWYQFNPNFKLHQKNFEIK